MDPKSQTLSNTSIPERHLSRRPYRHRQDALAAMAMRRLWINRHVEATPDGRQRGLPEDTAQDGYAPDPEFSIVI